VGDPLYSGRFRIPPAANPTLVQTLREFPRQALHARFLELDHPGTGERLKWEARLTDDFVWLLALLQQDREAFVGGRPGRPIGSSRTGRHPPGCVPARR